MKTRVLILIACLAILAAPLFAVDGTYEIVGQIDGLIGCTGITFDGTYIWFTQQHASGGAGALLRKIDPATMTIVETITLPLSDYAIQGLAWDGRYIWISADGFSIYRFDPTDHSLQFVCRRSSNPQPTGLAFVGSELYFTAWSGNIPPEHIARLEASDCSYETLGLLGTVSNLGLTWDGARFLTCGRLADWPTTKRMISAYDASGNFLWNYDPFNFVAYDIAWDGEYLWVCDYSDGWSPTGHVYKVKLHEPQLASLVVTEVTGSAVDYPFSLDDARLYQRIENLGPSANDWSTGAWEFFDVYLSDAAGNCLNLQPGDPLPDPVYVTIRCLDLNSNTGLPDNSPDWIGAGCNIDGVQLMGPGLLKWGVELTSIRYGNCDLPQSLNTDRVAENALGMPDGIFTGMGGGLTSLTMRLGTLQPFACADLNNVKLDIPIAANIQPKIRILNAPFLNPSEDPFDPAGDAIRVAVDGIELLIPAGALLPSIEPDIYTYQTGSGGDLQIIFSVDLASCIWQLQTWGIATDAVDNENGVTIHFTAGDRYYEETLFMDVNAFMNRTTLAYHLVPSATCGTAVVADNDPRKFSEDGFFVPRFALEQNYPNPFNPSTEIRFSLPQEMRAELKVYDLAGRLVATLADGVQPAGERIVRWDGRNDRGMTVSSGIYFYRLSAGSLVETKKMILLR